MTYDWIGWTFGAIGIAFGLYTYFVPRNRRNLVYTINPVRTRIAISKKATDLKLFYKNEDLGDVDISAVQIAIWNAGNQSIHKNDILTKPENPKNIIIKTEPQTRILETSIRNSPNEYTGIDVLCTHNSAICGQLIMTWEILEKNDGAAIQIIYVGNPEVKFTVEAKIEDQGLVKYISRNEKDDPPTKQRKLKRDQNIGLVIFFLIVLVSAILEFVTKTWTDFMPIIFGFSCSLFVIISLAMITDIRKPFPPFDF